MKPSTACLPLLLALSLFAMTGCAARHPRPLSFEEQQAQAAKTQCLEEATSMNSEGAHNSSNPFWTAYFEMCMRRLGVTNAELKKMWY
ncbi:hypothetical protein [Desulfovibrio sp. SGI.169]|uniref:hypothetical protein n=1 Tax=Desulfovibrio sp. SGI.169 TaxID=3420561 RepID=UPI003D059D96